tara:strand:+ start:347 stop:541 length:195 start_codon:yes stop_codon:yes gene_type:complete
MDELKYRVKGVDMLELIEQEMVAMWLHGEIEHILKEDEEFVNVITSAIMLERSYWSKYMPVGEA